MTAKRITVDIANQTLTLFEGNTTLAQYIISTGKNGVGEIMGSECTPRGRHIICAKIGEAAPINTVFVGRVATGEIYTPEMRETFPQRDWILTRIMWLSGCEEGRNKGGDRDSQARYIYLHGTPDDVEMGKPGSRGCIRLRNQDIIELFDAVEVGTTVNILEACVAI